MPLYQYDHEGPCGEDCQPRFEVLRGISEPPLTRCPKCGQPCRRVFSPFRPMKGTKTMLSPKNLEKHGFTQYKKAGGGYYEKTCGDGPRFINRD